jgi:hypothetical protein
MDFAGYQTLQDNIRVIGTVIHFVVHHYTHVTVYLCICQFSVWKTYLILQSGLFVYSKYSLRIYGYK